VSTPREVWITGIGIVSALGEGLDEHWSRLMAGGTPPYDDKSFAPYITFPVAPLNFDAQIPKKGDQRQMEAWQRIGVYAAGLALTDAGIAKNADILDKTDMIVAAGGGERDVAVDSAILTDVRKAEKPDAFVNERLMSDLRPTLFLAQLPNLLAGNISLVHGVVGSSRTFMGEEASGVDARCASRMRASPQARARSAWSAALITARAGTWCCCSGSARRSWKARSRRSGIAGRKARSHSRRWAPSW
jgi:3-oxoacyl-[acyl-carrier-protein] synthase II